MTYEARSFLWFLGIIALVVAWIAITAVMYENCEKKCAPQAGRLVRGLVVYECICGGEP